MGESPRGLDLDAFAAYVLEKVPGLLQGPLQATLIAGGKSNLTYVVSDGIRDVIVRRPPLGHVLATAHDMAREHRVISALAATEVPVPATYALCTDDSVIGAPFYVMERAPGVPYRTAAELRPLGEGRTRGISERLVDTLVALHRIDPASVGLADFGRPEGFLSRQVARWGKQYAASRSRDLPAATALQDALAQTVPAEQPAAIVHGDYRLDNVLLDAGDNLTAVLDWEMATIGDPLTDLGILEVYQRLADIAPAVVTDVSRAPGYLPADDMRARYAAASGRDLREITWYVALAWFKLGVILEGIHFRYLQGQTVGDGFADMGEFTPVLFDAGLAALQER